MPEHPSLWRSLIRSVITGFIRRHACKTLRAAQTCYATPRIDDCPSMKCMQLTPIQQRILKSAVDVIGEPPDRRSYQHAVLCQCGLPRKRTHDTTFERTSGAVSLKITAGELWDGRQWLRQPLPYGTRPRLALIHVATEAVRTRSAEVEVGHSVREFLKRLGIDTGGKEYARFQRQMRSLAATEMRLGIGSNTMRVQPIQDFAAWLHPTGRQRTLWPATIRLTMEFFTSLLEAAVPLDPRALAALSHSSLCLDVYAWLSHRLHRVRRPTGERVSWISLKAQFGQEIADQKNFVRKLRCALGQVRSVYPDARIEAVRGGLLLLPSKPPVPKVIHGALVPASFG